MNRLTYLIIILIISLSYNKSKAQDCADLLKDYASKISQFNAPEKSKVYYMNIDVSSDYKEGNSLKKKNMNIRMFISKNKVHYISDVVSIFADEDDYIVIMHPQKIIIRADGRLNENISEMNKNYGLIYNQLIDSSEVYSCKNINENGRSLKYFHLIPDENHKKAYKTDKVKYYFDLKSQMLYKTIVYFTNSAVVKQTTVFNDIDFDYKKTKIKKAKNMLFDLNNNILPQYRHYQYINNKK